MKQNTITERSVVYSKSFTVYCKIELPKVARHSLEALRNGVALEWQPPSMSIPMKRSIAGISKNH